MTINGVLLKSLNFKIRQINWDKESNNNNNNIYLLNS